MNLKRHMIAYAADDEGAGAAAGADVTDEAPLIEGDEAAVAAAAAEAMNGDGADSGDEVNDEQPSAWWPDDWRNKIAGEGENRDKLLKKAENFSSPADILTNNIALEQKLHDRNMVPLPHEKATEEDLARFRREWGVPEEPTNYEYDMPEGAPDLTPFELHWESELKETAYKDNWNQGQYQTARRLFDMVNTAAQNELDGQADKMAREHDDARRVKYGADYRPTVETINRLVGETLPEEQRGMMDLRLENGMRLGDYNPFFNMMASVSNAYYGPGSMINGEPADGIDIGARKKAIMEMRATDPKSYAEERTQKELMDLIAAEKRMANR